MEKTMDEAKAEVVASPDASDLAVFDILRAAEQQYRQYVQATEISARTALWVDEDLPVDPQHQSLVLTMWPGKK